MLHAGDDGEDCARQLEPLRARCVVVVHAGPCAVRAHRATDSGAEQADVGAICTATAERRERTRSEWVGRTRKAESKEDHDRRLEGSLKRGTEKERVVPSTAGV